MFDWGVDLGDDSPLFGDPLAFVMVTKFLMWSFGWPTKLSVMTAPVELKSGSSFFANTYVAMMEVQDVRLILFDLEDVQSLKRTNQSAG